MALILWRLVFFLAGVSISIFLFVPVLCLGEHGGLRGQQGDTPTAHSQTNLRLYPLARWSRLQPWLLTSELKLHSQHFMVVISSNLNLCSVFGA